MRVVFLSLSNSNKTKAIDPSSADSRIASCKLMMKEWAISKLPPGGLHRNVWSSN